MKHETSSSVLVEVVVVEAVVQGTYSSNCFW